MKYVVSPSPIGKFCALIVAALVLPVLARAGTDNGNGNVGQNNGKQNGHDKVATVADAKGPAIVLLAATIGTILLFTVKESRVKGA